MIRYFVANLLAMFFLAACEKRGIPSVVLYSSIDETYARLVAREFEKDSGIRVDILTDSEAAKSSGLVQRLTAEKERPVADVFWSGDPLRAFKLEAAGVGQSTPSGSVRVRLVIFNTKLVHEKEVPQRVEDLARPDNARRACVANPLFGSTSMHFATILNALGRTKTESFLENFVRNGGRIVASNGEVKRRVANGEFAFGITDSDDVAVALGEGKQVGFVVPDQGPEDIGSVVIPAVPVIIRNSPHPELATTLSTYLSSEKIQRMMAESDAEFLPAKSGNHALGRHLQLEISKIKTAPTMTHAAALAFEVWQREFLEKWIAGRSL